MTKGLKARVKKILEKYPQTRDDDATLIMTFYEEYYYLTQTFSREKFLAVMQAESPDDIVRFRRHIQNKDYECLPTNENVMIKRRMNIDKCREVLGYGPQKQDTL